MSPTVFVPGDDAQEAAVAVGIEAVVSDVGGPRRRIAAGGAATGFPPPRLQALFRHDPVHGARRTADPVPGQQLPHRPAPDAPLAGREAGDDGLGQLSMARLPHGGGTVLLVLPGVKTGPAHAQPPAHLSHGIGRGLLHQEPVDGF